MLRQWKKLTLLWLVAVIYAAGLCLPLSAVQAGDAPLTACVVALDADGDSASPSGHPIERCVHQCASCSILPSAAATFSGSTKAAGIAVPRVRLDGLMLAPELLPPIL